MHMLEAAQANFVATINQGPDALDPTLFAGPINRVLLGLKAHANTINHARLVALEDSFPLTRQEMGEAAFNTLSRDYVETDEARACDSNSIGRHFADFLTTALNTVEIQHPTSPFPHIVISAKAGIHHRAHSFHQSALSKLNAQVMDSRLRGNDEGLGINVLNSESELPLGNASPCRVEGRRNEASITDLATIEWAWLEAYHAADAKPLLLETIGAMGEAALLDLQVAAHPAMRLVALTAPLSAALSDVATDGQPHAILIVRPEAEVRLVALDAATTALVEKCATPVTIGNLLGLAAEQLGMTDPSGPVLTLIGAGALVAME
jgi:hypothetical protein